MNNSYICSFLHIYHLEKWGNTESGRICCSTSEVKQSNSDKRAYVNFIDIALVTSLPNKYPQSDIWKIQNNETNTSTYELNQNTNKSRRTTYNHFSNSSDPAYASRQIRNVSGSKQMKMLKWQEYNKQWMWKICTQLFVDKDLELMSQLVQTNNNESNTGTDHNDLNPINKLNVI